jgi:hypothetical protein
MTSSDIDVAELFHENTKITPFENGDEFGSLPQPLERGISHARMVLPRAASANGVTLEYSIAQRKTARVFNSAAALPLETLSQLLAFSCGLTAGAGPEAGGAFEFHRAAPSAGAAYAIEVYPVLLRAQGCTPGAYRYEPGDHSLTLLRPGAFHQQLAKWTLYQPYVADTSVVFVMAGFTDRLRPDMASGATATCCLKPATLHTISVCWQRPTGLGLYALEALWTWQSAAWSG